MRWFAAILLLSVACGSGPIPTARIDLEPATLCEGDDQQSVILSGDRSRDANGFADTLRFAWRLSSEPIETVRGNAEQEDWVVRFSARHPVTVALTVEDEGGRIGTREKLLTLVRRTPPPCAQGCASHQTCVDVGGEALCVDDRLCAGDDECGCLSCKTDDSGQPRCLP